MRRCSAGQKCTAIARPPGGSAFTLIAFEVGRLPSALISCRPLFDTPSGLS
jgi:hypothetical protein